MAAKEYENRERIFFRGFRSFRGFRVPEIVTAR